MRIPWIPQGVPHVMPKWGSRETECALRSSIKFERLVATERRLFVHAHAKYRRVRHGQRKWISSGTHVVLSWQTTPATLN